MSKITKDDVSYVSVLSRLYLDDHEIEAMTKDLNAILEYADKLNELDTSSIPPTSHAIPLCNVFREDKVKPSLSIDDVLLNAPDSDGNCFKVPKIIQEM